MLVLDFHFGAVIILQLELMFWSSIGGWIRCWRWNCIILESLSGQLNPGIPIFGSFNGARFTGCFLRNILWI